MADTIIKKWNTSTSSFDELYPRTSHTQIVASGTPNSTTFLRGDGTWATPAGGSSFSTTTVTIATGDWSSQTATKTVSGVTSSSYIWVSPANASYTNYANAQIRATGQGTNSITFTCTTTPTSNIDVVVVWS